MDQAYPSDEISGHKMISSSESTIIPIPPSTNYCGADSPSATGAPTPVASTFVLTQPSPSSRTTKEKSHIMPADELVGAGPNRVPISLSHVDAPRCPHLEECMFPRFLSLDCKQIDDFCMGCVGDNPNVKRLGRIYVEALHLQEFLKNPQSIESEKKLPIMNGSGKRLREPNPLPLSKRSSSSPSSQTGRVANEEQFHLSQNYFGGLEGKRTWLHNANKDIEIREEIFGLLGECTTDEDSKYRKASPSSNELLDNSKAILASFPNDTLLSIRAVQPESLEDTVVSLPVCTLPDCVGSTHQTTEEIQGFDEVPPSADDCKNIDCRGSDTSTIVRSTPQLSNESLLKLDNVEGRDKLSSDKQSVKTDTNTTNRSLRIESNFERATREGRDAALKANQLLESFRRNRRKYWAGKLRSNGKAPQCLWCPRIDSHSDIQFGMIKDDAASSLSFCANDRSGALRGSIVGDDLVQCLECDLVGCAPTLLSKENSVSHQHAMLHFLMSGHRFGE